VEEGWLSFFARFLSYIPFYVLYKWWYGSQHGSEFKVYLQIELYGNSIVWDFSFFGMILNI